MTRLGEARYCGISEPSTTLSVFIARVLEALPLEQLLFLDLREFDSRGIDEPFSMPNIDCRRSVHYQLEHVANEDALDSVILSCFVRLDGSPKLMISNLHMLSSYSVTVR